jgi:hypothetical protein
LVAEPAPLDQTLVAIVLAAPTTPAYFATKIVEALPVVSDKTLGQFHFRLLEKSHIEEKDWNKSVCIKSRRKLFVWWRKHYPLTSVA